MALANNLTAILNLLALLCSIPITASGIWLASKPDNECVNLLRWPVVVLGVLILLVSACGFIGAYQYKETLLAVYLCCMAILIGLLLVVLIFAFVVTRPDGSYQVPGRGYKEYRLEGFSNWLRENVVDSKNWGKIRACLADTDVCPKLTQQFITADQFFASSSIIPLQSGCCKPPTACGYNYVNPTLWQNPSNMAADADCYLWSNDQSQLCYNCNSCRAGLLGNLRKEWRKANLILIITVVVLIWVYVIACSAFRNAQTEDLFRKYKQGWLGTVNLCRSVIRSIETARIFDFEEFPRRDKVTYMYYTGRLEVFNENFPSADTKLSYALQYCNPKRERNIRMILKYLIPVKLSIGIIPKDELLQNYNLHEYAKIVQALRKGDLRLLRQALQEHEDRFLRSGVYLVLEKLELQVYQRLMRKIYIIQKLSDPARAHQLKLEVIAKALRWLEMDMDLDEVECIMTILIYKNLVKGYLAHKSKVVVLSKQDPFPKLNGKPVGS